MGRQASFPQSSFFTQCWTFDIEKKRVCQQAGKSQEADHYFFAPFLPTGRLCENKKSAAADENRRAKPPRRKEGLPAAADGTDLESIALNLLHLREKKINLANLPIKHSGFRIYKDCNSPSGSLQFIS